MGYAEFPAGEYNKGMDALGTSHLRLLKELAALTTCVSTDKLCQRHLSHAWWRRTVKFWNTSVDLPDASIYKQAAFDSCRDAITQQGEEMGKGHLSGVPEDLGMYIL